MRISERVFKYRNHFTHVLQICYAQSIQFLTCKSQGINRFLIFIPDFFIMKPGRDPFQDPAGTFFTLLIPCSSEHPENADDHNNDKDRHQEPRQDREKSHVFFFFLPVTAASAAQLLRTSTAAISSATRAINLVFLFISSLITYHSDRSGGISSVHTRVIPTEVEESPPFQTGVIPTEVEESPPFQADYL